MSPEQRLRGPSPICSVISPQLLTELQFFAKSSLISNFHDCKLVIWDTHILQLPPRHWVHRLNTLTRHTNQATNFIGTWKHAVGKLWDTLRSHIHNPQMIPWQRSYFTDSWLICAETPKKKFPGTQVSDLKILGSSWSKQIFPWLCSCKIMNWTKTNHPINLRFFCLLMSHIQWCSSMTPNCTQESLLLVLWAHMECWGSNLSQLYARLVPCLLYYHSNPPTNFVTESSSLLTLLHGDRAQWAFCIEHLNVNVSVHIFENPLECGFWFRRTEMDSEVYELHVLPNSTNVPHPLNLKPGKCVCIK